MTKQALFRKGCSPTGKKLTPKRSKFFPIRVNLLLEAKLNHFDGATSSGCDYSLKLLSKIVADDSLCFIMNIFQIN